jgi:hypothetical protein
VGWGRVGWVAVWREGLLMNCSKEGVGLKGASSECGRCQFASRRHLDDPPTPTKSASEEGTRHTERTVRARATDAEKAVTMRAVRA